LNVVKTQRARLTDMVTLFKAVGGGWEQEPIPIMTSSTPVALSKGQHP